MICTQLFSGRYSSGSGIIGYAFVGAMCSTFSSVSWVSPEFFQGANKQKSRADLSAHELGHLFGLEHCDCAEPIAFTMNDKVYLKLQEHMTSTLKLSKLEEVAQMCLM